MVEVPSSASLVFRLPKNQIAKAQRALRCTLQSTSQPPNAPVDVDESKVTLPKRTERRHAREWVRVRQLSEQQLITVVHYREVVRYKIYLLIRKRPYIDNHWRKKIKLEWDENMFRAVFQPLGDPTRPTIIQVPRDLALTLDGAWASKSVRMLQVLARPGKILQDFCSFQDFQRSKFHLFMGYAFKHIDVRFILELAAIFTCKSTKLPGNRMEVSVYVTISKITDDFTVHHALPAHSQSQGEPVLWSDDIKEEVTLCCNAMKDWTVPHSLSSDTQNPPSASDSEDN